MAFSVPPLPYAYDALEPHIDKATMEFHHDKHHQAYVDKANAALEGTPLADASIEDVLKELKKEMTIILVTNLVQQARRLAARTMFLWNGEIIELGPTSEIFSEKPKDQRTYEYVNGIFG